MAYQYRWYSYIGPSANALANAAADAFLGTGLYVAETLAHGPVVGIRYDDNLLTSVPELDTAMWSLGLATLPDPTTEPTGIYARVATLESALAAIPATLQTVSEYLTTAGSAIGVASGWQTVIDAEITLPANAELRIDSVLIANMPVDAIGGHMRVVRTSGSGDTVLATLTLPAVSTGADKAHVHRATGLAAGTYTVRIEAQATVAVLGQVAPQAGTGLILTGTA